MDPLEIAADICKTFEGFRPRPYLCPAGVPTIGFGSTAYPDGRRVTLKDPPITIQEAESLLLWELKRSQAATLRYCPVLRDDPPRQGAIIDFVYNLGPGRLQASTLRRRINQRDWPEAKRELMKWVRGGVKKLTGLVRRRTVEASLL